MNSPIKCYADSHLLNKTTIQLHPPILTLEQIINKAVHIAKSCALYANYNALVSENCLRDEAIKKALNISHRAARQANTYVMIVDSLVMDLVLQQPLDIYSTDSEDEV